MVNQIKEFEKNETSNANPLVNSISKNRIEGCIVSADFWASNLPRYAGSIQKRANNFTIAASILSTITALGIWGNFAASTSWHAVLVVSLVAIISSYVAQVPIIMGYAKCAENSAKLGSQYGNVLGALIDSVESMKMNQNGAHDKARISLNKFEDVRREKNALQPYPLELQDEINSIRAKKYNSTPNTFK